MPSSALVKYNAAVNQVLFFKNIASARQSNHTAQEKQAIYHAALAINVAAWDAFLNNIVRDYFSVISDPRDAHFSTLHDTLNKLTAQALIKFNTPNWENSRSLLTNYTGYDPYMDWVWPARGMATFQVQERLNQILKVRHSFAHGFPMPPFTWNQTVSGKTRLTSSIVMETQAFFNNLTARTETGLTGYINRTFSRTNFW